MRSIDAPQAPLSRDPLPGVSRCGRCRMRRCLCAEIPRVPTRTRLVILRHAAERDKPSNTGRLAALALPGAEVHDYALAGAALDPAAVAGQGSWLLFPEGPPAVPPGPPPARLVVLDGTWQQARRMRQRIPALRGLPVLSLAAPAAPPRRLRVAPHAVGMSTLEAIAAALALLEGPGPAAALARLHDAAVAASLPGRERPGR